MAKELDYKHLLPIAVSVENGKVYKWCACGKSQNQPLCDRDCCDGNSVLYKAELTEEVYFCNCKQTKNPPFCDGSHAKVMLDLLKD